MNGLLNGWRYYDIGFQLNAVEFLPIIELWYENDILKYTHHQIRHEVGLDPNRPPQVTVVNQDFRQGEHPV